MIRLKSAALVALVMCAVSVEAKKAPEVTGLELQQIQSRDIEASTDVVFSAVMTVFQDAGFRILAADKATGLISAQASSKSKTSYNVWYGLGKKKRFRSFLLSSNHVDQQ